MPLKINELLGSSKCLTEMVRSLGQLTESIGLSAKIFLEDPALHELMLDTFRLAIKYKDSDHSALLFALIAEMQHTVCFFIWPVPFIGR
jgi:hypothetical protein